MTGSGARYLLPGLVRYHVRYKEILRVFIEKGKIRCRTYQ